MSAVRILNFFRPVPLKGDVSDISDAELVSRAVRNARSHSHRKGASHPRWVAVMDIFALGSTHSRQLCERFGLDPDEQVRR